MFPSEVTGGPMSVYHCPLCPLIFQYRSEVEWHLREEHRSRRDEEADLRAELAAAAGRLDWDRLQALRSSGAGPAVTLLLATTPASSMTVLDIARLRQLADRPAAACRASPTEVPPHPRWPTGSPRRWPRPRGRPPITAWRSW